MSPKIVDLAQAMFEAAGGVLGALVDKPVAAGEVNATQNESSIVTGREYMATLVSVPSAGLTFVVRYPLADLARVVELMLGSASGGGELDAMQRSIVSETISQVSSAMAERLADSLGVSPDGIHAEASEDAASFPAPPFASYEATLAVADALDTTVSIDFDGLAVAKLDDLLAPAPAPAPAPPPAPPRQPKPQPAPPPEPVAEEPPQSPRAKGQPRKPASVAPPKPSAPAPPSQPVAYPQMRPTPIAAASPGHSNLDLMHDIPLQISAVLGQTALSLRDVVALQAGSVFELDKLSTDPIDLYVNNILIARGEVVVVDDKFAVKISELNPGSDRA